MPIVTQPDLIEQSDFSGGWAPDGLTDSSDPSVLLDASNVLLDRNTGALAVRKGFKRLREELGITLDAAHYIRQIHHWPSPGSDVDNFIICVVTNRLTTGNGNVQLWAISVEAGTVARIDNDNVWANPTAMFWFMGIDGLLYGGSKGNGMFTWDGSGTITEDVEIGNFKEWVTDTGGSVNTAQEYGKDYAWKGTEFTWLGTESKVYMPNEKIRFNEWESGQRYADGDRISNKTDGYWKSYRCIDTHVAAAGNEPDSGADYADFWKRVTLPKPKNDDNETSDKWVRVPLAAKTSIAAWFADRLFLRFDGQGDNSRLQYSAPVKPDKGEDIPDVSFDPTDFAPGNDFRGQGGGWLTFNDGKHQGPISALHPFGQYLLVFKRRSVWALSGSDNSSWSYRRVARGTGCVGQQAHVEQDGLVFFLSDDGLYATDGTAVEPVEGDEKVRLYLRSRLDSLMQRQVTDNHQAALFKHNGFIGIILNDASASPQHVTLFYDPETGSWWKTDLPVLDWQNYRDRGVEKAAFVRAPASTVGSIRDLVYIYDKSDAADLDDTGADTYAGAAIAWLLQTAWFPFGTHREQRRIRRVWAVVKGAISFTLKGYSDWTTTEQFSVSRTGAATTSHIEGNVMKDAHAVQLKLSGAAGGASIYGTAIDSQRRRKRYHSG